MILSDATMQKMIQSGELVVRNWDNTSQKPAGASIDLSLGDEFMEVDTQSSSVIDPQKEISYKKIKEMVGGNFQIPTKSFWLATTQQYIELPNNVTAFVEGRSSIGRMGLFVQNAGWIAPGFCGKLTLELFNAAPIPIALYSGIRVCQIVFCKMDRECIYPYRGKYQGQSSVLGSLVHQDQT